MSTCAYDLSSNEENIWKLCYCKTIYLTEAHQNIIKIWWYESPFILYLYPWWWRWPSQRSGHSGQGEGSQPPLSPCQRPPLCSSQSQPGVGGGNEKLNCISCKNKESMDREVVLKKCWVHVTSSRSYLWPEWFPVVHHALPLESNGRLQLDTGVGVLRLRQGVLQSQVRLELSWENRRWWIISFV